MCVEVLVGADAGAGSRVAARPPPLKLEGVGRDVEPKFSWPKLPPLIGVKSKKREILSLGHRGIEGKEAIVGSLTLASRVVLHGLSTAEAKDLIDTLSREGASDDSKGRWRVQRHEDIKIASLSEAEEDPSSLLAAKMPHVLVVLGSAAKLSGKSCADLAAYPGGLLVLADEETSGVDAILTRLGISEKWCFATPQVFLPSLHKLDEVPASEDNQGPTFLHDVRLRAPSSPQQYNRPWLGELLEEQFEPLYLEEFGAGLENLCEAQRDYGLKLSLLLDGASGEEMPTLAGFLVYKPWSKPQGGASGGASVCAVGVNPQFRGRGFGRTLMQVAEAEAARAGEPGAPGVCTFRSVATAVGFYSRLGYQRVEEEVVQQPQPSDDCPLEDMPCVPMQRVCEPRLAAGAPASRRPLEPWSPRRARHLEDGPTWMPVEALLSQATKVS